ncbi:MAG: hypothetical protein ACJ8F7_02595 [Gemmataceae bacterium]
MTPADEIAALRAEVSGLRRQVHVLFAAVLVAVVVAAAFMTWRWRSTGELWNAADTRATKVEAQEYHLLDPDGNLRGLWRCPPAGPTFSLLDENGRPLVVMQQGADGTVNVSDGDGRPVFERPRR